MNVGDLVIWISEPSDVGIIIGKTNLHITVQWIDDVCFYSDDELWRLEIL